MEVENFCAAMDTLIDQDGLSREVVSIESTENNILNMKIIASYANWLRYWKTYNIDYYIISGKKG